MLIFISVKLKSIELQVKLWFETSCRSEFKLKLKCVIKPTPSDYLQKTCTKKYKRKWLKKIHLLLKPVISSLENLKTTSQ